MTMLNNRPTHLDSTLSQTPGKTCSCHNPVYLYSSVSSPSSAATSSSFRSVPSAYNTVPKRFGRQKELSPGKSVVYHTDDFEVGRLVVNSQQHLPNDTIASSSEKLDTGPYSSVRKHNSLVQHRMALPVPSPVLSSCCNVQSSSNAAANQDDASHLYFSDMALKNYHSHQALVIPNHHHMLTVPEELSPGPTTLKKELKSNGIRYADLIKMPSRDEISPDDSGTEYIFENGKLYTAHSPMFQPHQQYRDATNTTSTSAHEGSSQSDRNHKHRLKSTEKPWLAVGSGLCLFSIMLLIIGAVLLALHVTTQSGKKLPAVDNYKTFSIVEGVSEDITPPPDRPYTKVQHILTTEDSIQTEIKKAEKQVNSRIRGMLDTSVDPCQDFFSYSCGQMDHYLSNHLRKPNDLRPHNLVGLLRVTIDNATYSNLQKLSKYLPLLQLLQTCVNAWTGSDATCLVALRKAIPGATKDLALHTINFGSMHTLTGLYSNLVYELKNSIQYSEILSPHTKHSMIKRLEELLVDSDIDVVRSRDNIEYKIDYEKSLSTYKSIFISITNSKLTNYSTLCDASSNWDTPQVCLANSTVIIPSSLFLLPLFHHTFPPEILYSYIGTQISNVLYDAIGPTHRKQLYSAQSELQLANTFECFSQVLQQTDLRTESETINSLVKQYTSLSIALKAFTRRPETKMRLVSFMSPNQLFYVNWAQTQCSVEPKNTATSRLLLNSVVNRFVHFSKTFQCPSNSPLHWSSQKLRCQFP